MNRFDDELRLALRREEPSPDFTDRVIARIAELQKQEKRREKTDWLRKLAEFFQPPQMKWMKWAMAGAVAVVLLLAGFGVRHRRENERLRLAEIAEGERAKEQVMLAMRIASAKLNVAQKKVYESAIHEGHEGKANRNNRIQ